MHFRDLTYHLQGVDRFLPCRNDDDNIFTCACVAKTKSERGGGGWLCCPGSHSIPRIPPSHRRAGVRGAKAGVRGQSGRLPVFKVSPCQNSHPTILHIHVRNNTQDRFVLINDLYYTREAHGKPWSFKKSQFRKLEISPKVLLGSFPTAAALSLSLCPSAAGLSLCPSLTHYTGHRRAAAARARDGGRGAAHAGFWAGGCHRHQAGGGESVKMATSNLLDLFEWKNVDRSVMMVYKVMKQNLRKMPGFLLPPPQ